MNEDAWLDSAWEDQFDIGFDGNDYDTWSDEDWADFDPYED